MEKRLVVDVEDGHVLTLNAPRSHRWIASVCSREWERVVGPVQAGLVTLGIQRRARGRIEVGDESNGAVWLSFAEEPTPMPAPLTLKVARRLGLTRKGTRFDVRVVGRKK